MLSLRFFKNAQRIGALAVMLSIPLTTFSADISKALTTNDNGIVTRGDFIRAAIVSTGVPVKRTEKATTTFSRPVPRAMQPYVNTADKLGALSLFGKELSLSKGITRGEALVVLMYIEKLQPTADIPSYTDVKAGSDIEKAVRIAIEKKWMDPLNSRMFGTEKMLTGSDGRALLRKVTGDTSPQIQIEAPRGSKALPTTMITTKSKEAVQLPESDLLRTVWQLVKEQFLYTDKIKDKDAAYKAAEGLLNSLGDPYTTFMRPIDSKQFQEQIDGEVSGIGAQVEYRENSLVVVAPLSGSPAQKAGLKPGDKILSVDGVSLAGLNLAEAVNKVRGEKGVAVKLTVDRDGTIFDVNVTRDVVRVPEIDISYQNDVAIVKIAQFGQTTDRELRTLLQDVETENPKGLVLDLRNNPGGLLHAAEITLSNFLPEGSAVAVIKSRTEEFTEVTNDKPTISADMPIVVLINKGSASSSEIVAGALQDHGRAKLLGETTFGKGTVQQVLEFRDGSSMKMTIAEWFTPKSRKINGVGLAPDVKVAATEGRDEQLLRAIDLLR